MTAARVTGRIWARIAASRIHHGLGLDTRVIRQVLLLFRSSRRCTCFEACLLIGPDPKVWLRAIRISKLVRHSLCATCAVFTMLTSVIALDSTN